MIMPLALETVRITLDGHAVELRPSLRAAARLEAAIGFKTALEGIAGGSLTIMAQVIEITGDYPAAVAAVIREIDERGICQLEILREPLVGLITQMVGVEEPSTDTPAASKPSSNTEPLGSYFRHLFKIGTGWLGWSPDQTWHATPAEIRAAYEGRIDLLKSIFGGKNDSTPAAPAAPETLTQKIRSVFAGFATNKVKRSA